MECIELSGIFAPYDEVNVLEIENWIGFLKLKCPDTYKHCVRVAFLAEKLAPHLKLDQCETKCLMTGCFVHDLGKTLLPEHLLYRRGPLQEDEWTIMKLHPVLGADLLRSVSVADTKVLDIVQSHHERWDGKGYPNGLKGTQIPYLTRICSVVDSVDSMLSDRHYRKSLSYAETLDELRRHSGTQWDEQIVKVFLDASEELRSLYPDHL